MLILCDEGNILNTFRVIILRLLLLLTNLHLKLLSTQGTGADKLLSTQRVKLVKLGKSCGVDGLSAEHFMYAGNYVKAYLSILFTSFISHGYLPDGFMKSAIIPLINPSPAVNVISRMRTSVLLT